MKLSDNAEVQKLIADHTRLRGMWSLLGDVNPNSRYARFSAGYFEEAQKDVYISPFQTDEGRSTRLIVGAAAAIRALVVKELEAVEAQLGDLGVKADE